MIRFPDMEGGKRRPRIILLFGAGIVLPSLLLGYLAFRGIRNDRALVEKERLEETRRGADKVFEKLEVPIAEAEGALAKIVQDHPGPPDGATGSALEGLAAGFPLIERIFYLQEPGTARFPAAEGLFVPDGQRGPGPLHPESAAASAGVSDAERLEFRENDLPAARAAYAKALQRIDSGPLAGMILNAMARVQRKSGLLNEALATYEIIAREHGSVILPGSVALGPSAALEMCAVSRELKDIPGALQSALKLYRGLLRPEWTLERAEFEFFVLRARSLIEGLLAGLPPGFDGAPGRKEFEELGAEEGKRRNATERMIAFVEKAAPALRPKLNAARVQEARASGFVRMSLELGNSFFLVSVKDTERRTGGEPGAAWGIIFDPQRLLGAVLEPALRDHFPPGETPWEVKGRDGVVLSAAPRTGSGPVILKLNPPANFPDWTLEFREPPARLIKSFLFSRRGLYSFIFLLIAGILVFGLILTLRSVSHELELARMKSDFVSTVSHEFKSPLTSIRQLAEMLQSGRVPSDERRRRYYDVLLEQSERLSHLTDNILNLAKIEEGRPGFAFGPTDVSSLLTEVVADIQDRVRHEGFEIGLDIRGPLPPVDADRTALSQAVANLIDNAIKYSGDSRIVSVRASIEGPFAVLAVEDRGIGIEKDDLGRIFERFYRGGDALTRTVKGSGLGLTLVKKIAEAHRGRVRVESEVGKGSIFSILVPFLSEKEGRR